MIKVIHFQRKPNYAIYSIERLFEDIRSAIPDDINVEVHMNYYSSEGFWRRLYDILRAALKQGDVNHVTGDVHFITYLLKRKKTILTIHDCGTLERLCGWRYWIFWFFWYWLPAKRSAVITVISESTKKELQRYLRSNGFRIEVIPDCVSSEFQPYEKTFNQKCPRILQVGTTKNKNIERVAEALSGLSCCLVIIGQLSNQQRIALQKYDINFENHVGISRNEMVSQYQQADILIFVSLYEGFGLPILEANAVGRPVITSNLYSMPEVGGDAACYVNPYKVTDIRSAIEKIINDVSYRNKLIDNGFRNVKRFRSDAIANQYAALYRALDKQEA